MLWLSKWFLFTASCWHNLGLISWGMCLCYLVWTGCSLPICLVQMASSGDPVPAVTDSSGSPSDTHQWASIHTVLASPAVPSVTHNALQNGSVHQRGGRLSPLIPWPNSSFSHCLPLFLQIQILQKQGMKTSGLRKRFWCLDCELIGKVIHVVKGKEVSYLSPLWSILTWDYAAYFILEPNKGQKKTLSHGQRFTRGPVWSPSTS